MLSRTAKIGLIVAGVLAGLLLGEVGLRLLAPQVHRRPPVWEFDTLLGWRHAAGASGTLETPEFEVALSISPDGLRDTVYARQPEPGTLRILAFGDSFVEGWGVPIQDAVSRQIQTGLQPLLPGRRVEVLNFGVAGYGTDQELLYFDGHGPQWGPSWVLVFFYGNDLWNNAASHGMGTERGYKPRFELTQTGQLELRGVPVPRLAAWDPAWQASRPWRERWDRRLTEHLHVWALLRRAMSAREVSQQQEQRYYEALYGPDPEGRSQRMWDLTGALLAAFRRRVEASGARLLVVHVPAIVQVEAEDWRAKQQLHGLVGDFDLDRPSRQLAQAAQAHGLDVLDLLPAFREAGRQQVLYYRDSHWNAAGHALAGQLVARALAQRETRVPR